MKYLLNGTWCNDDTVSELPKDATLLDDVEWAARHGAPVPPTQEQLDAEAAQVKYQQDATAAKAYAKLTALKSMTPAQVQVWVAANVTNLAQAQDAIATLAIAVSLLARRL